MNYAFVSFKSAFRFKIFGFIFKNYQRDLPELVFNAVMIMNIEEFCELLTIINYQLMVISVRG